MESVAHLKSDIIQSLAMRLSETKLPCLPTNSEHSIVRCGSVSFISNNEEYRKETRTRTDRIFSLEQSVSCQAVVGISQVRLY